MADQHPPTDPFGSFEPPPRYRWLGHLVRRAGFGLSPARLQQLGDKSPDEVLNWLFEFDLSEDPFNALAEGLEGFVNLTRWEEASAFWFHRMLHTPRPLQERVALFWHNHFACAAHKVGNGRMMHNQIELFRRKGLGSFRDLLVAVGRDPAMLVWLDGQANRKGKPNENYGREVMELFTLGVGNYTEKDVKELSRAFTGWRVDNEEAVFDPKQFDDGEKEVLGQKGKFDSDSAVDLLLSQEVAPKFIARKLLIEFVHPEPAEEHVNHYASRLKHYGWEIKPVLREMLTSKLFFSDWAYRSRVKSPVELAVGAALAIEGRINTDFLRGACNRMGQNLLNPPNVKGWPGGSYWINASTVLYRFNFAMELATQRRDEFVRRTEFESWLKENNVKTADDVLEHYTILLMDDVVPEEMRTKLIDYMNRNDKNEPKPFELNGGTVNSKVKGVLHLLMTMPEFQLA